VVNQIRSIQGCYQFVTDPGGREERTGEVDWEDVREAKVGEDKVSRGGEEDVGGFEDYTA
jgi:hypothetical protein